MCSIGALSQMLFVTWSGLARKPGTQPECKVGDDLAAMLGCKFMHLAVPGGMGSGGSLGLQEQEEHYLSGIKPSNAVSQKPLCFAFKNGAGREEVLVQKERQEHRMEAEDWWNFRSSLEDREKIVLCFFSGTVWVVSDELSMSRGRVPPC